jgi:hypothetical protein
MHRTPHQHKSARDQHRTHRMTVAGQLFKHFGLQMYSGAVPALAELISNAYDAMERPSSSRKSAVRQMASLGMMQVVEVY